MSPCFSAASSEAVNEPDTDGPSVGYFFENKARPYSISAFSGSETFSGPSRLGTTVSKLI